MSIHKLSLEEIAAWQLPALRSAAAGQIIAHVPPLQRGAVWKPGQTELLWDSLMRGFPIGSFVICPKITSQKSQRTGIVSTAISNEEREHEWSDQTHHLIDGQQRSDAIALAFDDPFQKHEQTIGRHAARPALWLDIAPGKLDGTTRFFLFRLTTQSHPWGYRSTDDAGRLESKLIRSADGKYREIYDEPAGPSGRFTPRQSWPERASAPIPVQWLIKSKTRTESPDSFWQSIRELCELKAKDKEYIGKKRPEWIDQVLSTIMSKNTEHRDLIYDGLNRALSSNVVAIEVTLSVLENTRNNSEDKISGVEHLFARLNAGGTKIEGEELSYSMIKAYWPKFERTIEELAAARMPGSRLARIGCRIAMIDLVKMPDVNQKEEALPEDLTVNNLRNMAKKEHRPPNIKDPDNWRRNAINAFFERSDRRYTSTDGAKSETRISPTLELVDKWLSHSGEYEHTKGLPSVLISSIARGSPDVYLLLGWLARRELREFDGDISASLEATRGLRSRLQGLATAVHWFGLDPKTIVKTVYNKIRNTRKLGPVDLDGCLINLINIAEPARIRNLLLPPKIENIRDGKELLKAWDWEKLMLDENNKEIQESRLIKRLYNHHELLLFAQRDFISDIFHDYDPSRQDLWQDSNRPWDFDHIIPSKFVAGKWYVPKGVRQLVYSIGNLRAWPMEKNRSDQALMPKSKLLNADLENESEVNIFKHNLVNSFLTQSEIEKLEILATEINEKRWFEAHNCLSVISERISLMYRIWFDKLEVNKLLC